MTASAQDIRTIAETSGVRRFLSKPQVNGDNAAYQIVVTDHDGNWTSCEVYRYALTDQSTTRDPQPVGSVPVLALDRRHGHGAPARRQLPVAACILTLTACPIGGPASTVPALPNGQDQPERTPSTTSTAPSRCLRSRHVREAIRHRSRHAAPRRYRSSSREPRRALRVAIDRVRCRRASIRLDPEPSGSQPRSTGMLCANRKTSSGS